jgi:tetratricopeptide (TPR) repeat protein
VGASAGRIASQFTAAQRNAEAVPWLLQAARDEARVGGFASALELLDRASEGNELDVEVLSLRAELLMVTGNPRAPEAYEQAIKRARGPRRESLQVGLARTFIAMGDMQGAGKTFAQMLPPESDETRLSYLVWRSVAEWALGQVDAAEKTTEEATALAIKTGNQADFVESVSARTLVAHSTGRYQDKVRAEFFAVRPEEFAATVQEGHLCTAELYLYGGQHYDDVTTFARTIRAEGERSGAKRAVAFGTCLMGETALLTGDLSAADALLDEAATANLELGSRGAASLSLQRRAESAIAQGAPEKARLLLAMALDLARNSTFGQRHLLQRIYGTKVQAAKDPAAALAVVHEAETAIIGPTEGCFACLITFCIPAAKACAPFDLERAHRYLATAEQMAKMFWRTGAWYAAVEEVRGVVARAEGHAEAARKSLADAAQMFEKVGQKLDAERCRRAAASP